MPVGRTPRPHQTLRALQAPRRLSLTRPLASIALCLAAVAAMAQPVRSIPADAPQAKLVLAAPSAAAPASAKLDGKTVGVAPGLRVFGTDNQLLNTTTVAGEKLPVRYKLDLYGQLLTAWVLTEQEQKDLKAQKAKE